MPLDRIPYDQTNRPVNSFASFSEGFNFDAPYQRGSVWTVEQRRNLIKSLMQALPIGVIFINFRNWRDAPVVVDGKQRLQTIMGFMRDEFDVPAEWFADAETEASDQPSLLPDAQHKLAGNIVFSELAQTGRGRFTRNAVAFYETKLPTVEAEIDLYLRVNAGGTLHTPDDLDRARNA